LPKLVADFSCVGGECREHCCQGWTIAFDKSSVNRYLNTQEKSATSLGWVITICFTGGSSKFRDKKTPPKRGFPAAGWYFCSVPGKPGSTDRSVSAALILRIKPRFGFTGGSSKFRDKKTPPKRGLMRKINAAETERSVEPGLSLLR
jgi:hypothetical protein